MIRYWVLQGNPRKWDHPEKLYSEPILGWSVTGVEKHVAVGDGVLIWMASAKPAMRGIFSRGPIRDMSSRVEAPEEARQCLSLSTRGLTIEQH